MNFFEQGISLGRWFGIRVVIHWLFVAFAGWTILRARSGEETYTALYLGLLFATVLMHEFGHALACRAVGGVALHIVLWPLGGIAFVKPPDKVWAWLITTVCGPLVNAVLWPTFWLIMKYGIPALLMHGYGNTVWFEWLFKSCYLMLDINRWLLLFNLIPAYPMDGGRVLQELLWMAVGYRQSLQIAGMVGTVAGGCLIVLALGVEEITIPALDFSLGERGQVDGFLAMIGIMCMMMSFGIYRRSQEIRGWRKN